MVSFILFNELVRAGSWEFDVEKKRLTLEEMHHSRYYVAA